MLDLHCHAGFSLFVERGGYSLAMVLCCAVTSLAVEHGLWGTPASVVAAPGSIHGVFFFHLFLLVGG